MDTFLNLSGVICSKCGEHPEHIEWDYTYDYDGNDCVHEYGKYICQCGNSEQFCTNDPYEDEED